MARRPFRILLVAATPIELDLTVTWLRERATSSRGSILCFEATEVEVLFTGIGLAAASYTLGLRFGSGEQRPDYALQAGLAGAIDRKIAIGSVVQVVSESLGDTGATEPDGTWLSLTDMGLPPGEPFGEMEVAYVPPSGIATPFPIVHGVTVAQTTGSAERLRQLRVRWPEAQVETMEGAAFFRACLDAGLEPVQLRAISNYVEPRDRAKWQLGEAIFSLDAALQDLLGSFLGGFDVGVE